MKEPNSPGWMSVFRSRAQLEVVCQTIKRDSWQGTSADQAMLIVVMLSGPREAAEVPYIAIGGVENWDSQGKVLAAAKLDLMSAMLRREGARWDTGSPDLEGDLARLAIGISSFARHCDAGRSYATVYIRNNYLVVAYLDGAEIKEAHLLLDLLARARRAIIGQEEEPKLPESEKAG